MNSKLFLLIFLGTLSAFGPFVFDLYLPALPIIQNYFGTSTAAVQLTLSGTMAGLGFGQLVIGPLSDKFGRKAPLIFSLCLYSLSTIVIFFTPSIEIFVAMRVVQGFASAGGIVIARAVVRDLYDGDEMRRFFSLLIVINSLAPVLSPILGSIILKLDDWRGIFIALSLIGIALFIACMKFKESLKAPSTKSVLQSYLTYFTLLKMSNFRTFILMVTGTMGALFAYISSSSFIFQSHYAMSELAFGLAFGLNGFGFGLGAFLAGRIAARKAMSFGALIMSLAASVLFIALLLKASVLWLVGGFFLLLFGIGFLAPTTSYYVMKSAASYAGAASALLGFAGMAMGGVISPLTGLFDIFLSTACFIFLGTALCVCSIVFAFKKGLLA